ncbi:MAG: 3-dehydroquinate synthase [Rhodothermales bacterium]|nr:3-dehydroquinate synthase [Rhodothermales bacterium]
MNEAIRIDLPDGRGYNIQAGPIDWLPDALAEIGLQGPGCIIVTDKNVDDLYGSRLRSILHESGWDPSTVVLPPGEETKSDQYLRRIQDRALSAGIDRRTPLLAFGGGVTGDVGGFAAATLLRGIPLVQIPTTVIAQVDSAIGGKTGINHAVGKNLIGAFYQPRLVHVDTSLLATLPDREYRSGLAEAVKHALIADVDLFEWIRRNWNSILEREQTVTAELVRRAAAIKASVVSRDELETGLREILNFGHTFAHALELALGYGTLTHGEAVFIGMRAATFLSSHLYPDANFERVRAFLARIDVPIVPGSVTPGRLGDAMKSDKKKRGSELRFVVLEAPGSATVVSGVDASLVEAAWREGLGRS